jgi:hypothetical protein
MMVKTHYQRMPFFYDVNSHYPATINSQNGRTYNIFSQGEKLFLRSTIYIIYVT